jgi:hypothetical protein
MYAFKFEMATKYYKIKNLIISKTIITDGAADNNAKVSFVEHQFTKPTDVLVQVVQTSCFFHPQQNNF